MPLDVSALGPHVRDRRVQLGLSVRGLAARAAISPAYVTAIESGRSPSTGRPPVVSLDVVTRLAAALELDIGALVASAGSPAGDPRHVLAFIAAPPPDGLLAALDRVLGDGVDHWLHVADPRGEVPVDGPRATTRRFALGARPYATQELDADALLEAVEREVAALAPQHRGRRVGLLIADCSAVMRYLHDAASEVDLEQTWHPAIERMWQRHLGAPVAADVCAYAQDDLAALGLTIDQLATAVDLVERHDRVLLVDGDAIVSGAPAIRRVLDQARPAGASADAWGRLTAAAARALSA